MFRRCAKDIEVFLVHPGGPFFGRRDNVWGIPKGERHDDEDLLTCAKREFTEETGIDPGQAAMTPLGSIQYNNKTIYCWTFEKDLPENFKLKSNLTPYGWPEIDKGEFFNLGAAASKILPGQKIFLERLFEYCKVNN